MFERQKRMMMSCLLAAALLCAGCFKSKTEVTRVPNEPDETMAKLDGVHYSLPQTVVTSAVPIKRKEVKPGVLEKFTPCFFTPDLAEERVIFERVTFSLEQPTIDFRMEPDPKQHFVVSVKGGLFEKKSLLLDYAPGMIITKGEAESTNQALDFTFQAIKTGTSILSGILGIPGTGSAALPLDDSMNMILPPPPAEERIPATWIKANRCYQAVLRDRQELRSEAQKAVAKAKTAKEKKVANQDLEEADQALASALAEMILVCQLINPDEPEKCQKLACEFLSPPVSGQNCETALAEIKRRIATGAQANPDAAQASPVQKAFELLMKLSGNEPEETARELVEDFERAEKTFKDIENLEKKRLNLISGANNSNNGGASEGTGVLNLGGPSAETLRLMLKELDAVIEERKALFFGTEAEGTWTGNFEHLPSNLPQQAAPLFWFAEREGVCAMRASKEQGIIVPKKFQAKNCPDIPADPTRQEAMTETMDIVFLTIKRDGGDQIFRDQMARVQTNFDSAGVKRGWYYRIPAPALVLLKVGNLEGHQATLAKNGYETELLSLGQARGLQRDTMDVAQLGVTVSVPSSGAGRTNQSTVEYDSAGALKNFKYASDPLLQQSQLQTVEETAQTAIDARTKRNEEKAKANDPLNKLKRELDALETQNKINEQRKILRESNNNNNR